MSCDEAVFRVGGITDMSTVDWYGSLSMVVFWAGCNFRCPYCQNSSLIPLDSGQWVGLNLLRDRIENALTPVETIEAVVFTGGEPLLQPDGVVKAARLFKEYGIKVMLNTNGSMFKAFSKIIETGLVDRVALDVKAPLNVRGYATFSNSHIKAQEAVQSIKSSLQLCAEKNIPLELRTTVAPGISDSSEFIKEIASSIKDYEAVYYLQQFDNYGDVLDLKLKESDPPSRGRMVELAREAIEAGLRNVYIKTRRNGLEKIS
jgi:pyruvate formate lyase activating enzyme